MPMFSPRNSNGDEEARAPRATSALGLPDEYLCGLVGLAYAHLNVFVRTLKTSEISFSVVASIVSWNHAHCVEGAIRSLLEQTCPPKEVVVYDNASTDQTRRILGKFGQRIRVIQSPENRGFCGGHNAVIDATESDSVLLVNPDVVLSKDYIENAVLRMRGDPGLGSLWGLLRQQDRTAEGCLIDGAGLNMSRSRHPILRYNGACFGGKAPPTEETFGADGALPLYRRRMIDDIQIDGYFFDPMFFAHKEDHDISWRARIYGWKSVFEPACVAIHPRHFKPGNLKLRQELAPEIKYHAVKNDLLLLLKNEDFSNFVRDSVPILARQIAIFCYVLLLEPSSLKAYWFVLSHLRAILRNRRKIKQNRKASPSEVRSKFLLDWAPQEFKNAGLEPLMMQSELSKS